MNLLCLAVLLLLAADSTKAATLSGTVSDSEGAAISKALVIVHWAPSGSNYLKDNLGIEQDITATTDSRGQFSVDLPAGFYDVFVSAATFLPHCDKVRLKDREAKTYKVKLKLDMIVSKELD